MFCNKERGTLSVLLVIERLGHRFDSHLIKAKQGLRWLLCLIGLTMGFFLHIPMSACHLDARIGNPYIQGQSIETEVLNSLLIPLVSQSRAFEHHMNRGIAVEIVTSE